MTNTEKALEYLKNLGFEIEQVEVKTNEQHVALSDTQTHAEQLRRSIIRLSKTDL